ncbi:MAG: glycosyltransferase family 39 protein [Desulfobacca sp.]|nr:glycosyltransferase family 39 protein [Desulfobacca sp.]
MDSAAPLKTSRLLPVLGLILALGLFLRCYGLGERNLWTDEAWVALAALEEHPAQVLQEGQSTPPLYLWCVWAMVRLGGPSEARLRLTSCLFGVGTLILIWPLARRLLSPGAALLALALVAISPRLVYYSKELKQYSADAFFAVLALILVERLLRTQGERGWLAFTLAMILGLGFSHPLIFVLPVAAAVLWWELPAARGRVALSFGTLALAFLGYYLLFFRYQVDPELVTYWQRDFPDLASLPAFLQWLAGSWARYLGYFLGDWPRWLVGLGFLGLGLYKLGRGPQPRAVLYWLGPLVLALGAAFLHRYPFMAQAGGVRLMLFSAPLLYLVVGAGVMAVAARVWEQKQMWLKVALVAGLLIWINPWTTWPENLHPQANREQIHPLVDYLEAHLEPGEVVYVYYFAIYPFKFYYQGAQDQVIWGQSCQDCNLTWPPGRKSPPPRLWLIFSHFEDQRWIEQFSQRLLGDGWHQVLNLSRPGAALWCFVPRTRPAITGQLNVVPNPGPS